MFGLYLFMVYSMFGSDYIAKAIESDLVHQGLDVHKVSLDRLARAAVRALRQVDDETFVSAGVDPKIHRENFEKVTNEILKGL